MSALVIRVELLGMGSQYEIVSVDSCMNITHADFFRPSAIYVVRRIWDGATFRIKFPKQKGWETGAIVRIDDVKVLLNLAG